MVKARSYNAMRPKTPKKKRSVWGVVFDYFVLTATVAVAGLLLAAYLSPYIPPNTYWIFSIFGLSAPVLFALNVLLLLYWVVRWKGYAFVPLVALVIGFGNMSLFYRPFVSKQYSHSNVKNQFKVVSYNVRGFMDVVDDEAVSTLDTMASFIADLKPDILCIQEYQITKRAPKTILDAEISELSSSTVYYTLKSSYGGWGLAIYSRYPIIRSEVVEFENSTNSAMWADIRLTKTDTIRLFNCHLQTTSINKEDRQYIENQEFIQTQDELDKKVKNILRKLKSNYIIRANQADTLSQLIAQSPYPVFVCGDFNDTPLSYVYHTMRGNLLDSFVEKGRGLSTTFNGLFNMFRIDYMFHSSEYQTVAYEVPPQSPSDHKPVCVSFVPVAKEESKPKP